ncbi:uncharacterized protein [Pocillopora verrucosa]|uniref:uncharacterized protein n=1 Tax=Pocillopora verrucosa TaxID=203993 RepID=UPI003342A356
MRIVYDASSRATPNSPSLNNCLYPGPVLQNKLWVILIQQKGYPVILAGDIRKAFLQIRIHESERDALRFLWRADAHSEIEIYRLTRVLFGLAPSPFLLGGVLEYHLNSWAKKYPEEVERLRRSFYVDDLLTDSVKSRWEKWKESILAKVNTQRPLALYHKQVDSFELHAFGDASTIGVGAAVYSVIHQKSGVTQSLVTAKARLAKKDLTIPRSELVSAHMATNLVMNVKNAPTVLTEPAVYGWLDTDIASRGGLVTNAELWWSGPAWLRDPESWPENPVTKNSQASEKEAKVIKEVLSMAKNCLEEEEQNEFDRLLNSHDLQRALHSIQAWIRRFHHSQRSQRSPHKGRPARTKRLWISRVQNLDLKKPQFTQTKNALNLIPNSEGILEYRGRIQGMYPVSLPADSTFTRKLVQRIHAENLHRGVSLTMAAVQESYWIPKLRKLVKSVRSTCWGCKWFTAPPLTTPPPGPMPNYHTLGGAAFEVIGTDFAVHLELVPSLKTGAFLPCLKRLIARRGRPRVIYSDNGSTFVKAAKWLKQVREDEKLQGYLESHDIKWKFNLSNAPWWGGQFERLIGVVKKAMHKVIGRGSLFWNELIDVLLEVETQVNRRLLNYVQDDPDLPILRAATFLFQWTTHLPEE